MSNGPKRPYAQVLPIAQLIVERLAPYCQRIEIAGSLRRQKPTISDIEIVAIPKHEQRPTAPASLFAPSETAPHNLLWAYLDQLMQAGKIAHPTHKGWGDTYRKFTLTTTNGLTHKIDLFTATAENWGNTLLIRTGSADFSRWMVTPQSKGGALPDGYHHSGGMMHHHGRPIPLPEEADYFNLCGLPYIPPTDRTRAGMPTSQTPQWHALTLKQPWADGIMYHGKDIENRAYPPPADLIGQRIAIHAGKTDDELGASFIEDLGYTLRDPQHWTRGAIVATAVVTGVVRQSNSPWFMGPYGWQLADVRPLNSPLPCRGYRKLWPLPQQLADHLDRITQTSGATP